jgi:hypothetical protein
LGGGGYTIICGEVNGGGVTGRAIGGGDPVTVVYEVDAIGGGGGGIGATVATLVADGPVIAVV